MPEPTSHNDGELLRQLESRVNSHHLRQRLGIEQDHETQIFGRGQNFFHLENWYSIHSVIRGLLRLSLLYGRGHRNAVDLQLRHNSVPLPNLPAAFDGFTVLQLSDLHLDMHPQTPHAIAEAIRELDYDLCVITGDFRARTHGEIAPVLEAMSRIRPHFRGDIFAVLGNHDTIRLVPGLEALNIRVLLNETVRLERDGEAVYLSGVDDPHYYRTDNLAATCETLPEDAVSLLLSHSPELYRHAAHAGFDLMLSGHTHGGQICLPGGIPVYCNMRAPRYLCRGPWRHHSMQGYTASGSGVSVVEVRLNCPPEITLHHLQRGESAQ
jgi:predicted MPP superfamily phosphohydrolase